MKILFKIMIFAVIAIVFAMAMNEVKAGHVIIFISDYRLDFSLISLFLIIILTFIVLYYLINILLGLQNLSARVKSWTKSSSKISKKGCQS